MDSDTDSDLDSDLDSDGVWWSMMDNLVENNGWYWWRTMDYDADGLWWNLMDLWWLNTNHKKLMPVDNDDNDGYDGLMTNNNKARDDHDGK